MLEFSTFTLNRYIVIGFKSITKLKGCVPSDLRCEMAVMPLNQVLGRRKLNPLNYLLVVF